MTDASVGKLMKTLRLLARPGLVWGERAGLLTLDVHGSRDPERKLISYTFIPYEQRWAQDEARTIQALAELIETAAALIAAGSRTGLKPLTLTGELFNRGFMLNSFELADLFEIDQVFVEEDAAYW